MSRISFSRRYTELENEPCSISNSHCLNQWLPEARICWENPLAHPHVSDVLCGVLPSYATYCSIVCPVSDVLFSVLVCNSAVSWCSTVLHLHLKLNEIFQHLDSAPRAANSRGYVCLASNRVYFQEDTMSLEISYVSAQKIQCLGHWQPAARSLAGERSHSTWVGDRIERTHMLETALTRFLRFYCTCSE
jgi:hypothetical protein